MIKKARLIAIDTMLCTTVPVGAYARRQWQAIGGVSTIVPSPCTWIDEHDHAAQQQFLDQVEALYEVGLGLVVAHLCSSQRTCSNEKPNAD